MSRGLGRSIHGTRVLESAIARRHRISSGAPAVMMMGLLMRMRSNRSLHWAWRSYMSNVMAKSWSWPLRSSVIGRSRGIRRRGRGSIHWWRFP